MLKSLPLAALFVSTMAFSQRPSCLENLCLGNIVADENNYVGVVSGFKDGRVLYRRDGNNYDNTSSVSSLSPKTESNKFLQGSYSIDESNYVGKIRYAFADGRVQYQREGNNYYNISKSVSPEMPERNGIKKDVSVIDENNYVGVVKRVFENGKTQYQRQGNNYTNISSNVSPAIPEAKDISRGVKIIDENNYVGTAENVFKNGKIQYRRNGNNYSNISSSLSTEVPELKGTSSGMKVMDENNYSGVAKTVFKDGRIEYQRDGNNYSNISTKLTHEIPKLRNGTQTGTVVLDENNYVGEARTVYEDGRTLYRRKGNNYNNVSNNLSYEVEENKLYEKEIEYASPQHSIGEVLHFFSNGKIELSGESYTKICDKLFVETQEVEGVAAGTEVVIPGSLAVVEKIFENSTARVIAEEKKHAIHILTLKDIEDQMVRHQWITALSTQILHPDFKMSPSVGIKKEDHKQLLDLILKDLDSNKMWLSKNEIKAVREYVELELAKK